MKTLALRATAVLAAAFPLLVATQPASAERPAGAVARAGSTGFATLDQDTIRFGGLPHVSLGKASLDTTDGSLVIGNIGSEGDDGVGVRGFKLTHFGVELGDPSALGVPTDGAYLEIVSVGSLDGGPASLLGSSRVTQSSTEAVSRYELSADFSPMGASLLVCEVFDGETRVIRVAGLENPVANVDSWPSGAAFTLGKDYFPYPESGPTEEGGLVEADWLMRTTGAVLIVENRFGARRDTTVMGNRVRIFAEDPNVVGGFLTAFDLLAKDIPTVTIPSESSDVWNVRAIHEGSNEPKGDGLAISPNPAPDGRANISFRVPWTSREADLAVFDASGRRVRTLASGAQPRGLVTLSWDGRDDGGRAVSAGIYFLRLSAGERSETRRVTLLR